MGGTIVSPRTRSYPPLPGGKGFCVNKAWLCLPKLATTNKYQYLYLLCIKFPVLGQYT